MGSRNIAVHACERLNLQVLRANVTDKLDGLSAVTRGGEGRREPEGIVREAAKQDLQFCI